MPRKKMTEGEKSSLAARKRLVEIKRTVATGKRDAQGKPLTERRSFYGATKEAAEASCRDYCQSLDRPAVPSAALRTGSISWWLRVRYLPLKQGQLRASSSEAIVLAGNHLERHLGTTLARDVGAAEISTMLAKIGKSASLRNKVRGLALDVMELAAEEDRDVRPVSRRRVVRAKDPAPRIEVLSPREARALVESLAPNYRPAAYLMAFLGLRSGEAIAVLARDLTPIGTLTVRRQDDGFRGWTSDLKTEESRRELPLPAALWDLIAPYRAGEGEPLSRTGQGVQIDEAVLRRAIATARERLGLDPCKGHTLHALRHGCATWLATNGCPEPLRLAILGQSRSRVADRYVHASPATMLPHLEAMWAASEGAEAKTAERKGNERNHATGMRNGRAKIDEARRSRILERLEKGGPENAVKKIARDEGISPKAVRNARAKAMEEPSMSTESVVATTTSRGTVSPGL